MIYIEDTKLVIKQYQTILNLDKTSFECIYNKEILRIIGKNIEVEYLDEYEIILKGIFQCIYLKT